MENRLRKAWKTFTGVLLIMLVLITAISGCGGSSADTTTPSADTLKPTAPTGLTAAASSDTAVTLNWTAATDNVGVTGYIVFRGTAQVGTTTGATSFSDTGLAANTPYTYTIKAKDAADNISSPSTAATATTLSNGTSDIQPPTNPAGLSATASGTTSINLAWTASTDNYGVSGYNIYRATSANAIPSKVGFSPVTSYNNTGLAASTTYYYIVKAIDGASNESLESNKAAATTAAIGSTTLTVKVRDYNSQPLAGVTVVLGDSTGAMVSTSSYAVTGASGDVTFANPPANATVTAAKASPWTTSQTYYDLHSLYDVNASSVALDLNNSSSLGTANVTVTNGLGAAVSYWYIMPNWASGDPGSNPSAVMVQQGDVQSDNKVSFFALGYDGASGEVVGFGTALDQTFTNGMSLPINLNQTTFTTVNHTISNVPATAVQANCSTSASRKGVQNFYLDSASTAIAATTACTGRTIPGYGDQFGFELGVDLDQNYNGNVDAYYGYYKGSIASFTPQAIDLSTFPAIPANPIMTGAGTARPTFSWAGYDASADEIWASIYNWTTTAQYNYTFEAAPTRNSIQFPELPGTLAAFIPTTWISTSGVTFELENDDIAGISGYDAMLGLMEDWILGNGSGTIESRWGGATATMGFLPKPIKSKANTSTHTKKRRTRAFQR